MVVGGQGLWGDILAGNIYLVGDSQETPWFLHYMELVVQSPVSASYRSRNPTARRWWFRGRLRYTCVGVYRGPTPGYRFRTA